MINASVPNSGCLVSYPLVFLHEGTDARRSSPFGQGSGSVPMQTCRVLRYRVVRLATLLAIAFLGAPAGAQTPTVRDTTAIRKELAAARDVNRIPLLLELGERQRDQPTDALTSTAEALALLAAHPAIRDEIRVRIARSYALQALGRYPEALDEAARAERLGNDATDDRLLADACYQLSIVQWRMSSYDAALVNAERARMLLLPHGASPALARTLSHIGAIHYNQSELAEALESYLASLQMSEGLGDEIAVARVHNNIGLVYLDLGRNQEAYNTLMRALAIHERLGPRHNLTNTLNNVGLALIQLGRPREALPYLERALRNDRESGDLYGQAKDLSNIGGVHEGLKAWSRAIEFHQQALALRERIGDKDGLTRTLGALAEIRMRQGDAKGAIPIFERSIALAAEINARRDEAEQLALLAEARATAGDSAGAYRTYRRFHALEATLADSASRRQTADLEARYQTRERQRELDALRTLAESRKARLTWLVIGSVSLAFCLALLGIVFVMRARAQRAIAESEERYRALFQTSTVPLILVDVATQELIDLNAPAQTLCGTSFSTSALKITDVEPAWLAEALGRLFDGGRIREGAVDTSWDDVEGRQRRSEVGGAAVALGGRRCALVTVRDVTEVRREEETRQREDKLQSLGVLAGGIAHDFNNALMVIMGHVTLAREATPSERLEMLQDAQQAVMGASRLTAQLLAFSRGGQPKRETTDIGRMLRDTVAMAGAGSRMRVELDVPDTLWHANVDAGQFSQVVANIVINAKQATGDGGHLTVRARNHSGELPDGAGITAVAHDQRYVRIDFADNGGGIPDAIRHRVFDPYFTTRARGSGLGLATAFAICRNHGGALTFDSHAGEGTTFSAFFPASHDRAETVVIAPSAEPDGIGSILVLDDEPPVRRILQRMLEKWGYEVEVVADGSTAVQRYVERMQAGRKFDLLIMDLTIPGGMGGRQAMAEILRHDPSARAIVASGYSDDPTMADFRAAGFVAALTKPFQSEDLGRAVQAAMAS